MQQQRQGGDCIYRVTEDAVDTVCGVIEDNGPANNIIECYVFMSLLQSPGQGENINIGNVHEVNKYCSIGVYTCIKNNIYLFETNKCHSNIPMEIQYNV